MRYLPFEFESCIFIHIIHHNEKDQSLYDLRLQSKSTAEDKNSSFLLHQLSAQQIYSILEWNPPLSRYITHTLALRLWYMHFGGKCTFKGTVRHVSQ